MRTFIEKKLDTFGYKYHSTDDVIIVKLAFDQQVRIHCKGNEKCLVKYNLTGWNFLSGLLSMSLKGAVVYYSILLAVVTIVFALLARTYPNTDFSLFLVAAAGWFTGWTAYYAVTFESFKRQVIGWADQY
jgi:hypothetical protein